jgi:microcystin-dependent protein
MSTPFLAEIKMFSFDFAPNGWALCNGQLLPINQNQALFSLLGTTYGGNGQTTFALPDLRGRTPISFGSGHILGELGGNESQTLTLNELPAHSHVVQASSGAPNAGSPSGNFFAANTGAYAASTNASMLPSTVTNVGGSQSHANMSPYLVISFCIALQGIFPSRN